MATTEAPDIEEQYISAGDSSNLRVEAERRSDADILIAAGWSNSRLGLALMRLQTKPDREGLHKVHEQAVMQVAKWGIDRPDSVASAVIAWWLKRICQKCNGVKFQRILNTPALSAKACNTCNGTGENILPYGYNGKRLANWLDGAKAMAVQSIQSINKRMPKK